jgi:hypothetical protein
MTASHFQTCYISAPLTVDTTPLRLALQERGIRWSDALTAKPKGSTLDTRESAIAQADFLCVVFAANSNNSNVFFEAGIARGRHCPLLIFIEPGVDIPSEFQNLVYARTNLQNSEALNFHLDAFLQHGDAKPIRQTSHFPSKLNLPDSAWAFQALASIEGLPKGDRPLEFERLVARIFKESGAVVSQTPPGSDRRIDMAIWIDELPSNFGNPLLVETKYGQLSQQQLAQAESQLRTYINKVHAKAGLLIYWHPEEKKFTPVIDDLPLVIRISISTLIDSLCQGRFMQLLLDSSTQAA